MPSGEVNTVPFPPAATKMPPPKATEPRLTPSDRARSVQLTPSVEERISEALWYGETYPPAATNVPAPSVIADMVVSSPCRRCCHRTPSLRVCHRTPSTEVKRVPPSLTATKDPCPNASAENTLLKRLCTWATLRSVQLSPSLELTSSAPQPYL